MKDNEKLGFVGVTSVSSSYSGSFTIELEVGEKDGKYRCWAGLWHHEQDASREGFTDSSAGRGATAKEAIETWATNALAIGWEDTYVIRAQREMEDVIEEYEG